MMNFRIEQLILGQSLIGAKGCGQLETMANARVSKVTKNYSLGRTSDIIIKHSKL